jgi:hypothetical protein
MFSPGESKREQFVLCGAFNDALARFDWWLGYVKREIETPDLWEDLLADEPPRLEPDNPADHDRFTEAEQTAVVEHFRVVRGYIESLNPTEEALLLVHAKLDYLIEATSRLEKRDWKAVSRGVAFDIALAAMNPDQARHIVELMSTTMVRLLGG